jgi:potassium-transporting ATPase KdpC subunit
MRRQLLPAIVSVVIFSVLFGLVYPLVVTGVAQVAFNDKADGSFVERNGRRVGSTQIGQPFTNEDGEPIPRYFQPRPSAVGYDPLFSSGSNYGPLNPALIAECLEVENEDGSTGCDPNTTPQRARAYREFNGLSDDVKIPVDAVTASGSGLDPDISVANAKLQAARVAEARGLSRARVLELVDDHIDGRPLGFIGERTVNVLNLNLALDELQQ